MKRHYAALAIAASLVLGACTSARPSATEGLLQTEAPLAYARLGETVYVDGPKVTPLAVLEDNNCPVNARCVWAGQVRLRVRIDLGTDSREQELLLHKPIPIADGTLALIEVVPSRKVRHDDSGDITAAAYRFGFRFMGGL